MFTLQVLMAISTLFGDIYGKVKLYLRVVGSSKKDRNRRPDR